MYQGVNIVQEKITAREQEILFMLLDGVTPKEISNSINISYNTVITHQKNIYRKLSVQSINELLKNYSRENLLKNIKYSINGFFATFIKWETFIDGLGSTINSNINTEKIKRKNVSCCNIYGILSTDHHAHTGILAYPDYSTLEAMKTMSCFSFSVLGDGNSYDVMLMTSDTRKKGELNHYRKGFSTIKGKISTFNINVHELIQSPYFGKSVPFFQNNIEAMQFQVYSTGKFNLKIWDINIYQ